MVYCYNVFLWCFPIFLEYYFRVSFNLKVGNSVDGQNNSKCGDVAPLGTIRQWKASFHSSIFKTVENSIVSLCGSAGVSLHVKLERGGEGRGIGRQLYIPGVLKTGLQTWY